MKSNQLYKGLLCCALALPTSVAVNAQEDNALEEVVVTGSYIKRDKFSSPSALEVISAEDIKLQGQPSIAQVVRNLTITQNTDTVANLLGFQDGGQDSNSARFNLRGLGFSSTLTLFDGRRSVASGNINTLVPDIAIERVEIVLDGGAATYGTDAVAGVVNFIPIKKFDGFKMSTYYNRDDGGDFEEPKIALLAGKSFEELGIDIVGALDYRKKTPLTREERREFLAADDDDSPISTPGTFFTLSGLPVTDQNCRLNGGLPLDVNLQEIPPGDPRPVAQCRSESGQFQDYNRESQDYNAYFNVVYQFNDYVSFDFQSNLTYRESVARSFPSFGNVEANLQLFVPPNNPGTPVPGQFAIPVLFQPFGDVGTLPQSFDGNSSVQEDSFFTDRYRIGAQYQFGDTSWSGETYYSHQKTRRRVNRDRTSFSRLQAGLFGLGGPNCDPATGSPGDGVNCFFFSPTPIDPATGANFNRQDVVDFIVINEDYTDSVTRFWYAETVATGELFDLPAGPVQAAFGLHVRDTSTENEVPPLESIGDDYNNIVPGIPTRSDLSVRAAFAEFDVPVTDQFGVVLAVRSEEFTSYDLKTTVPKFSLRYEPFDNLAFRASTGKGFVAPDLAVRGPFNIENCIRIGALNASSDPFRRGEDTVGLSCGSRNPDVGAEESRIKNIGFSWKPIDELEISLDYQEISYKDRIVILDSNDLLRRDFFNFSQLFPVTQVGVDANGDPIFDFDDADAAAFLASDAAEPLITRAAPMNGDVVGQVNQVVRLAENLNRNDVSVFDFRASYNLGTDNWGFFIPSVEATAYKKYEYFDFAIGQDLDGVGKQNGQTSSAPPLPRWKINTSLNWFKNQHSASIRVQYLDGVKFDANADDLVADPPSNISSHTTIDLRYSYSFEDLFGGNVDFTIGSRNITDNQPDALPIPGGLETRLHDPFGRLVYAEIVYEPTF